jgi:hypothetical protein
MKILLNPEEAPSAGEPQAPAIAPGAPPPAASKVVESDAKESDAAVLVKLRRELEDEKSGRKKDQTRINELEDKIRGLTTPPAAKPGEAQKKGWLDGLTVLD